MSEVTRERILTVRGERDTYSRTSSVVALVEQDLLVVAICDLALLALDGEADRKLGAVVREAMGGATPDDLTYSRIGNPVLDAIASALRAEGA